MKKEDKKENKSGFNNLLIKVYHSVNLDFHVE